MSENINEITRTFSKSVFFEYFLFHILHAYFVCAIEASLVRRQDYLETMLYWFPYNNVSI